LISRLPIFGSFAHDRTKPHFNGRISWVVPLHRAAVPGAMGDHPIHLGGRCHVVRRGELLADRGRVVNSTRSPRSATDTYRPHMAPSMPSIPVSDQSARASPLRGSRLLRRRCCGNGDRHCGAAGADVHDVNVLSPCEIVYSWGSTTDERLAVLPCDELLPLDTMVADRAIDVAARPTMLFRWLCQLRAAPYSYDWIDNLGRRSPRTLSAGLDELALGQRFMSVFRLAGWEPDRQLTLLCAANRIFGAVAVTYAIEPHGAAASRLHARVRWRVARLPVARTLAASGDLLMMRKQLHTLARLAERDERLACTASGAGPTRGPRRAATGAVDDRCCRARGPIN
jgi:hypothetical protein